MKKSFKNFSTGLLVGLIGMACIGTLGVISKGFKDWNFSNEKYKIHTNDNLIDKDIYINYDNLINDCSSLINKSTFYEFAEINIVDIDISNSNYSSLETYNTHFTISRSPTSNKVFYLKFYFFSKIGNSKLYRGICDNYDIEQTLTTDNFIIKLTDTNGIALKSGVVKYKPFISIETNDYKIKNLSLNNFDVNLSKYFAFNNIWKK